MGSLSSIRPQSESLSNRFFSGFRVLELRILAAPARYYPPSVGGKNCVHASKDSMGIVLEPFCYSIERQELPEAVDYGDTLMQKKDWP
jgi:hypothetical protein